MGGTDLKKYRLDVILISIAALALCFILGVYVGRASVERVITVETGHATVQSVEDPVPSAAPSATLPLCLDLNTATKEELMLLDGVGEMMALRIVRYREETGGFSTIEELKEVYGIGEATYERLAPYLTVNH